MTAHQLIHEQIPPHAGEAVTPVQAELRNAPSHRRNSGVALIIVLGMLVLLSIIVVAFLTNVTADLGDSKGYEAEVNTRMLADSAVNLVIGEIRTASTGTGVAWVSQPGLIRTYDNTGAAVKAYKLYSSGSMIVTGSFDPSQQTDLPPDTKWVNQPNLWVDMNSPVTSTAGNNSVLVFPIIDGNGMGTSAFTMTDGTTSAYSYTSDGSTQDIAGFYTNPPSGTFNYTPSQPLSGSNNPVPMPVQWLYMLKDGTLLSATSVGAATKDVTLIDPNGALASGTNPIVARIAFWTDDESAKVNINTAAEGTFWDTPVCNTQAVGGTADFNNFYITEWDLAAREPDQKEYQRYPGHPATTCLSTVLGPTIMYSLFGSNLNQTLLTGSQRALFVEAFNQIAPRVSGSDATGNDYSSKGGTQTAGGLNYTNSSGPGNAMHPITPDTDRLYATTDELIYNLSRNLQTSLSGSTGDPRTLLQKAKFFLTTNSKSPETNLFNLPRVAIWPITKPLGSLDTPSDTTKMTAFDRLIAFCSTVQTVVNGSTSSRAFYYTRSDPTSTTTDISGVRNQAIYKYLATLMGKPFPGFGGTFSAKYPSSESSQVLTEIFDYIRTTNLVDTSGDAKQPTDSGYSFTDGLNSKAYTPPGPYISGSSADYSSKTSVGQVVPSVGISGSSNGTRGFGRIMTISEVALVMARPSGTVSPIMTSTNGVTIQFVLMPSMYCPEAGFPTLANNIKVHLDPANSNLSAQYNGTGTWAPMFASGSTYTNLYTSSSSWGQVNQQQSDESKIGGPIGIKALAEAPNMEQSSKGYGNPPDTLFPSAYVNFSSGSYKSTDYVTIGGNGGGPAKVTFNIIAPANSSGTIQTFTLSFPQTKIPVPASQSQYAMDTTSKALSGYAANPAGNNIMGYDQYSRQWNPVFSAGPQTVRSLVVAGSGSSGSPLQFDMRTIACMANIPSTVFLPVGSGTAGTGGPYFDSTCQIAHGIRKGCLNRGSDYTSGEGMNPMQGTFIQGPNVSWSPGMTPLAFSQCMPAGFDSTSDIQNRPIIPAGFNGVFNSKGQVGDWDNGPAFLSDGCYTNKPDEGTSEHVAQGGGFQGNAPYIGYNWVSEDSAAQPVTLFSPNRQVPSPVMFGSLPTGVLRGLPWQTLLFRPAKDYLPGGLNHPGAGVASAQGQSPATGKIPYPPYTTPPDHLLLDLFWMPVVEPYPMSEPFATAGKINLNYQIAPFTYIRRDTGLRAVLWSVKITALDPNNGNPAWGLLAQKYKIMGNQTSGNGGGGGAGGSVRRNIDIDKVLLQTDWRFAQNQPFRSASEICDIPLVPGSVSGYNNVSINTFSDIDTQLSSFWNCNYAGDHTGKSGNWLTGDNSLERPYALIYPRLTTKSNTYTIHVRVQSLKKATTTAYNVFKDGQDKVTGEFRGSFLIERYLDPTNSGFAIGSGTVSSGNNELTFNANLAPYKFRIISSKQFTP